MPHDHPQRVVWPTKVLHGIPNHETYRNKLRAKWFRKGFHVRFV